MSTHLENSIVIKGDKAIMIDLLSKVINTKMNRFQIYTSDWETEESINYSWTINNDSNYEVKIVDDKIQLNATFISSNEPPVNWIKIIIQQFPSLQIKLFAYNISDKAYLVRYNQITGLEYYKNYYLQITLFAIKEVVENNIGQLCYVQNGNLIKMKDCDKLVEINRIEHVKGEFSILKSLYIKYKRPFIEIWYKLDSFFSNFTKLIKLNKKQNTIDTIF